MDASEILRLYDLACEKAARNSGKIGTELREFPASETGDYLLIIVVNIQSKL